MMGTEPSRRKFLRGALSRGMISVLEPPLESGMRVDPKTGLLDVARQAPSPNQDDRPEGAEPELVVVH